jgi:hypothetical protein
MSAVVLYANTANSRRPNTNSMPPFGSIAHSCAQPSRIPGHSARIRDHSTDPLPAPVAPAIRTCVPSNRSSHGIPRSVTPSGSASRSGTSGTGSAGMGFTSGSRRVKSSQIRPGRSTRTRQSSAPKVCASWAVTAS